MQPQETLFGRSMTPAERLRQHQRSIQKATRELERERGKLEAQEKKTMMDIKKNAKTGNMVRSSHSTPGIQRLLSVFAECLQDPRKGSGPDSAVHTKVHSDARTATSGFITDADFEE